MSIFSKILPHGKKIEQPSEGQATATEAPSAPVVKPKSDMFSLPELDENDQDYEEKKAIHDAYAQLEKILIDAAPDVDYEKEYRSLRESHRNRPERKSPNPISAFAIAMGAGEKGLRTMKETEDTRLSEADKKWSDIFALQEASIKGDIQQKLESGKFRQALAQSKVLADLQSTTERIKGKRAHDYAMDLEREKGRSRERVAQIKAQDAQSRLRARLQALADAYKIEGNIRRDFFKSMFSALANRMTQQDITGDPVVTTDDLNSVLGQALEWAEMNSGIDFTQPMTRPGILTPAGAPAPTAPAAPANETPEQKALREIRAGKK